MYEGTRKAVGYDAPRRWPRVIDALARYIGGPEPVADDRDAALGTLVDYVLFRALCPSGSDTAMLRTAIRNAVRAR